MSKAPSNHYIESEKSPRILTFKKAAFLLVGGTAAALKAIFAPEFSPVNYLPSFTNHDTDSATKALPPSLEGATLAIPPSPSLPDNQTTLVSAGPKATPAPSVFNEAKMKRLTAEAQKAYAWADKNGVLSTILKISDLTGFERFRALAVFFKESRLGQKAHRPKTVNSDGTVTYLSSALGLGQIIESTFFGMIVNNGAQYLAAVKSGEIRLTSREDLRAVKTLRLVLPFVKFIDGKYQPDTKSWNAFWAEQKAKQEKTAKRATAKKGKNKKTPNPADKIPDLRNLVLDLRLNKTMSAYFCILDMINNKLTLDQHIAKLGPNDPRLGLIGQHGYGFVYYSPHMLGFPLAQSLFQIRPDIPVQNLKNSAAAAFKNNDIPLDASASEALGLLAEEMACLEGAFAKCLANPPKPAKNFKTAAVSTTAGQAKTPAKTQNNKAETSKKQSAKPAPAFTPQKAQAPSPKNAEKPALRTIRIYASNAKN